MKEDKEKWLDGVMKGMEDNMKSNCVGDFFKKMKRLNGSNVTTTTAILDENGHPLHKSEERLARWRQHFEKVFNVQGTVEENVIGSLEQPSDKEVPEITREEVEQAMKRQKNGRAAGEDEIVAELLKNGGDTMIDWVLEILQEVWRTKRIPQEWKKSILVPLHKKRDRKNCNLNYRGISLLSVPGKVLCLVLLDRLQEIINPRLLESQCGFRSGRGTVDQIWSARQIVERSIDSEYESSAYLGFVDLTKAYDSVDRSALLAVLSHYGVPRHLIDMVRELYTGTYCRVRTSEGVSDVFEVKSGVRQGCVLSPLLFNAYMDKIVRDAIAAYEGGL